MDTRAYYFMGNMGAYVIKCLKWEKGNFGELEIESLHFLYKWMNGLGITTFSIVFQSFDSWALCSEAPLRFENEIYPPRPVIMKFVALTSRSRGRFDVQQGNTVGESNQLHE